ncbi:MAG: hypothetical protein QXH32_08905 [Candidatus Caldarchaeum sp.]
MGRADLLFSFDVLDEWDEELESVNDGLVTGIVRALSKRVKRLNMGEGFKAQAFYR